MTDIITPDLVRLDADLGADKQAVIRALAGIVDAAGRTPDVEQLVTDAMAREETSPTGLPGGIAIPHCRTDGGRGTDPGLRPALAEGRVRRQGRPGRHRVPDRGPCGRRRHAPQDPDPAGACPGQGRLHQRAASRSHPRGGRRAGQRRGRGTRTRRGRTGRLCRRPPPRLRPPPRARSAWSAITACPTGIAHTYMAAEALEAAADKAGVDHPGRDPGLRRRHAARRATAIAAAGAVIFAVDVGVRDRCRFAGKPMVSSGVKRPIDDADAMIAEALRYADDPNAPRVEGSAGDAGAVHRSGADGDLGRPRPAGADDRRLLHDPVRRGRRPADRARLPASVATRSSTATARSRSTTRSSTCPTPRRWTCPHALFHSGFFAYLGALFFIIGKTAFIFFVPALAGYIAYAIADRPGIAPGFVMGGLAINVFGVTDGAATTRSASPRPASSAPSSAASSPA